MGNRLPSTSNPAAHAKGGRDGFLTYSAPSSKEAGRTRRGSGLETPKAGSAVYSSTGTKPGENPSFARLPSYVGRFDSYHKSYVSRIGSTRLRSLRNLSFLRRRADSTSYEKTYRLFSQTSRKQLADGTVTTKGKAARTAWPVSQVESLFLPDFPVNPEVNENHFEVIERIASGSYGNVLKVRFQMDGQIYAMKILRKTQLIEEGAVRQCKDEVQIQSFYGNHPFIVKAHYFWQAKQSLYIVMDYVPCGELLALWRKYGSFPEKVVQIYIAELAMVLDFLHLEGVIYRDLKMENILLDEHGHVQLTDFGLAKWLPPGKSAKTICGTLQYMAPEVLYGTEYNHAADWWTLGILMYALLMGQFPVNGARDHREMGAAVARQNYVLPDYFKQESKEVIRRLLQKKPTNRLTNIRELQRLPYFKQVSFDAVFDRQVHPKDLFLTADEFDRNVSKKKLNDEAADFADFTWTHPLFYSSEGSTV